MEATYKQPAKRTTETDGRDYQSNAVELFVPLVPHAQIEHESGEKPAFCHAQKEAGGEEPTETLSEACEGTDNTPRESECREPESWGRELEDDIAWDLEQDTRDGAGRQRQKKLVSALIKIW